MDIDPGYFTAISNPWQALTAIAFVAIAIFAWAGARRSRSSSQHAQRAADIIEHESKPNSGGSMKDDLTKTVKGIETLIEKVDGVAERTGRLEGHAAQTDTRLAGIETRLTHLETRNRRPWFAR